MLEMCCMVMLIFGLQVIKNLCIQFYAHIESERRIFGNLSHDKENKANMDCQVKFFLEIMAEIIMREGNYNNNRTIKAPMPLTITYLYVLKYEN